MKRASCRGAEEVVPKGRLVLSRVAVVIAGRILRFCLGFWFCFVFWFKEEGSEEAGPTDKYGLVLFLASSSVSVDPLFAFDGAFASVRCAVVFVCRWCTACLKEWDSKAATFGV